MTAPYECITVAQWLVNKGVDTGDFMTRMVLHKLCYFAYGFYHRQHKKELISDPFEVGRYGPIDYATDNKFKKFKNGFITDEQLLRQEIDIDDGGFLSSFWADFVLTHSPSKLVGILRVSESPWHRAKECGSRLVDKKAIKEYFEQLR